MAADGSIVIEANVDDKNAQKELNALANKIAKLEEDLNKKKSDQSAIGKELEDAKNEALKTEQAIKQLNAELRESEKITSVSESSPGQVSPLAYQAAIERQAQIKNELAEQENILKQQDKETEKIANQYTEITDKVIQVTESLNTSKNRAGELSAQLAGVGNGPGLMSEAVNRADAYLEKFTNRVKNLARRVFVFTLITMALRSMRDWFGKVIKTNGEATAAIAKLKGALLTLAQPLVNVIIPAFTAFVNVLTRIVTAIAGVVSMLFGTTTEQSAEAAENLYNEQNAIEGIGSAAKKASKYLAPFDEINQRTGDNSSSGNGSGSMESIKPDFSQDDTGWLANTLGKAAGWVTAALLLGGIALVAIGASIGSLKTVLAGLALIGAGIVVGMDTGVFQSWSDSLGLNNVQEFVAVALTLGGIALVAIGAATVNILLVIAGLALVGYAIKYSYSNGLMQGWSEALGLDNAPQYITAALLISGFALIVIGAVSHNILMVLAGIALIGSGIVVGSESGTIEQWWNALHLPEYAKWITPALLIGGMALIIFGIVFHNLIMFAAGFLLVTAGIKFGTDSGTFESWWVTLGLEHANGWITAALLIGGMALIVFGVVLVNIAMLLGGLAMLISGVTYGTESGTFASWWDTLGLPQIPGWVSTALLLGGIALVAFGIFTLNLALVIAGLSLLGVSVLTSGSSTSSDMAGEYSKKKWADRGKDVVGGLNEGLGSMGDSANKFGKKVVSDIADGLEIHSPSEATREDGRMLVQGIILGINETSPELDTTLQTTFNRVKLIVDGFIFELSINVSNGFREMWNQILNGLDTGINRAINGLNEFISRFNESFSIIRALTGYPPIVYPMQGITIPRLAAGAVIPPNREFLAVLGDQKNGTNIEAPESLIRKIVREETAGSGFSGEQTVILQVDREQLGKVVYRLNREETRRIGVRLTEV